MTTAGRGRGLVIEADGNIHQVPPWGIDDVVRGVLDGVADLKRRITHPSTRRG